MVFLVFLKQFSVRRFMQIKSLLDELVEVRNASPNAAIRQLASLQSQVRQLSVQHHAREQKLNTAMSGSADGYMRDQVEKLQTVVSLRSSYVRFSSPDH